MLCGHCKKYWDPYTLESFCSPKYHVCYRTFWPWFYKKFCCYCIIWCFPAFHWQIPSHDPAVIPICSKQTQEKWYQNFFMSGKSQNHVCYWTDRKYFWSALKCSNRHRSGRYGIFKGSPHNLLAFHPKSLYQMWGSSINLIKFNNRYVEDSTEQTWLGPMFKSCLLPTDMTWTMSPSCLLHKLHVFHLFLPGTMIFFHSISEINPKFRNNVFSWTHLFIILCKVMLKTVTNMTEDTVSCHVCYCL